MSWAGNQRLLIIATILFVVLTVLSVILVLTLPKEPSCSDGIQNQDENGIDCGGSCAYLCNADLAQPSTSYIRTLEQHGRIDVVALIKNNESSAHVKNAKYVVELYSPEGALLVTYRGEIDLPPGEEVPIFIPGIAPTGLVVGRALLTFEKDSLMFTRGGALRTLPRADAVLLSGTEDAPRISAHLFNPGARALEDLTVIVVVQDTEGNIMAASQTLVERLSAQSSEEITFSWNEPFIAAPGPVEIRAVVPL